MSSEANFLDLRGFNAMSGDVLDSFFWPDQVVNPHASYHSCIDSGLNWRGTSALSSKPAAAPFLSPPAASRQSADRPRLPLLPTWRLLQAARPPSRFRGR